MVSKLVVSFYQLLLEISMWLTLIICVYGEWNANGFLGLFGGLIAGFIIIVVIFGAFLIIGDIRESVRAIEKSKT
ncbi:MAG: hypothetical protein V3U75_02535 [Methylococcaceae bacterium]